MWNQIGNSIIGEASNDFFGTSVDLSSDGTIVAIGASNNGGGGNNAGHVRVYQYSGGSWTQLGSDIDGEGVDDRSGTNMSLSNDGTIVAIGAQNNDAGGIDRGHVRVYQYSGGSWSQLGADIDGQVNYDRLGEAVSISGDGTRVAIGSNRHYPAGHVQIYDYNGTAWVQVGSDIDGTENNERFSTSLSISDNGKIVAVGAPRNDTNGTDAGQVRVYQETNGSWVQLGSSLNGEAAEDQFGNAVSLSNNGKILAVGSPENDGNGSGNGSARIYQFVANAWVQIGTDIDGEDYSDPTPTNFGNAIKVSGNANAVIIGGFEGLSNQYGYAGIYSLTNYTYLWDVDQPSTLADGDYTATVSATDLAGNAYSGTDSVTFTVDTTNPTVTLTDTDEDNIISLTDTITVTAAFSEEMTATPTLSISGVVTNTAMTAIAGTNSYTYFWDLSLFTISGGSYVVTVSGTDRIGNPYSGTDSITFTLDTITPTVVLTDTDDDDRVTTSQTVTFTAAFSEAMTATPTISISGVVTDALLSQISGTNTYTYLWDTSLGSIADGAYAVTVSGEDLAGNDYVVDPADIITIIVDTVSPTLILTDTDDDNIINSSSTVTITAIFNEFMASSPLISIGNGVSGATMTAVSSSAWEYFLDMSGWGGTGTTAVVTVSGQDTVGNAYGDSDSTTFIIDNIAPTAVLSHTAADEYIANSDTITLVADFSEFMTVNPSLSVSGTSISNAQMSLLIEQIGNDIEGEAAGDSSGFSVAVSDDGSRVAIGGPANNGSIGHVRVYERSGSSWTQLGVDIDGQSAGDITGVSVALSNDGNILAIGAYKNSDAAAEAGEVRVYRYNGSAWVQVGIDIQGDVSNQRFGTAVSLSSDGTYLAASGASETSQPQSTIGVTRIYKNVGGTWVQQGGDIYGENAQDNSGWSIKLAGNGKTVAIGAINNDDAGSNAGHVRVYKIGNNQWYQLGADIDGEAAGDASGTQISLSFDGKIVAIGANRNDGNGTDAGHVRVYQYGPGGWTQLGSDIDGEAAGDKSGSSVALSASGKLLAVGATDNNSKGHVRLYYFSGGSWAQIGADIDGEATGDRFGVSVALSRDESTLVVGGDRNDGSGSNAGHVRVYDLTKHQYLWDVDSPSTLADGIYTATVSGTDRAGNAYTGTDSITFTIDTTAPTVTLTDTDDDNIVNGSQTVTITAAFNETMTATPTISISGVGTAVMTPITGTNSYTYLWDTSIGSLTDGSYVATVSGSDLAGNAYAGTDSITFTLDTTTPTVTLTDTDNDNIVNGSQTVTITAAFNEAMTATPTISISGVGTAVMTPITGTNSYTYLWDTSIGSLTDGSYIATVSGSDLAGNAYAGTDSITFTLDSTAPTVVLGDTDEDNYINASDVVTLTAVFSELMTATPTISIGSIVTNAIMSQVGEVFSK